MYITRLHVENVKLMRDLAFDFTHEGQPRMWTVFVAENGACKTTLLQTIALAASGAERANQLADVPSLPDLRQEAETAAIRAEFTFGSRLEKWRKIPQQPLEDSANSKALRLLGTLRIEPGQATFMGNSWFAPTRKSISISRQQEFEALRKN